MGRKSVAALGQATLHKGQWVVTAEPHVLVRLKRCFAQVRSAKQDKVHLSDTPDVARDLVWFMGRYPLALKRADRAHLDAQVARYDQREEFVRTLMTGKLEPRAFALAEPARDYQTTAAEFFLRQKSLLLADDMGLGKTITAICCLMPAETRPALIVAPKAVGRQWVRQLKRFAPDLRVHRLMKGTPAGYELAKGGLMPDVIVSTYAKLPGWAPSLAGVVRMVAFDECQELRHGKKSNKGRAAKALALAAEYRLGMSATPIYNLGGEFYWVLDNFFPGALGTREEFLTEWCGDREDGRGRATLHNPKAFGDYLRRSGMMLRRTRAEVKRELPGLTIIPHTVDSDPAPLKDVESAAMALARVIIEGSGKKHEQFLASGELSSLVRKATGVAKAPYVAEFVNLLLESEEKIVLFGWHHDVYAIWRERLKAHKVSMFTGEESDSQKEKSENDFIRGDSRVLIMSVRAAAGLDGLQAVCRTGVIGEPDYSPGVHEQCYTRLFRDGQADPVSIYFPLADDGSDPIIADILQIKRAQIEGVRSPDLDVMDTLETDGTRIRKLAEFYLAKQTKLRKTA
jgi:SNF2 family DNA or RNA helicase